MKKTVYSILLGAGGGVIMAGILLVMMAESGYILHGISLVLMLIIAISLPMCLRLFSWNRKYLISQILMVLISFVITAVYAQYVSGSAALGLNDAGTAALMTKTLALLHGASLGVIILLYLVKRKRSENETV